MRRLIRPRVASEVPNAAVFQWQPLNLSSNESRLLRFLSWKWDPETIRCDLVKVGQHAWKGGYVACSYVWGADKPTETIMINGKPFNFRRNLFDFLACLNAQTNRHEVLWFWVDAVSDPPLTRGHCPLETCIRNKLVRISKKRCFG